jgi:hypothetical protein
MSEIQSIIYALEVGKLRLWLIRAAIFVLIGGLAAFYYIRQFNGLSNPQAMEHAQLARQLSQGEGYTTKVLKPFSLQRFRNASPEQPINSVRYPELVNAPGYPFALSLVYRFANPNFELDTSNLRNYDGFEPEKWIIIFNLGCLMLSVAVFYIWMLRAFDDRVALMASFLFVLTDAFWVHTIQGLETPLSTLLICLIGLTINESIIKDEEESYWVSLIFLGLGSLFLGFLILTQYVFIAFLPVLIGLAALAYYQRTHTVPVAVVIPLLVLLPWFSRNFALTGHPFGFSWAEIFVDNGTHPGNSLWRMYSAEGSGAFGFRPLARALLLGVTNIFESMGAFLGGTVLVATFLLSTLHKFKRKRIQVSRWFWLMCLLLMAVFAGAILKLRSPVDFPELNPVICMLPVIAGFGSGFLFVLIDRLRLPSTFFTYPILILIIVLQSLPFGVRVMQRTPPRFAFPPYFPPSIILTNSFMEENEMVCSDIPWAYAWYANRPCVWLPDEKEDFYDLNDFNLPISAIILTPYSKQAELLSDIQTGQYRDWSDLVMRRSFENPPLPVVEVIPPNGVDYLLLTNKPRIR